MLPHSLSAGGVNRQVLLVRQVHEGPVTFLEGKECLQCPVIVQRRAGALQCARGWCRACPSSSEPVM